MTYKREIM